jgi:hypothetical protein
MNMVTHRLLRMAESILALAVTGIAQNPSEQPLPPEVKKTIEAVSGQWVGEMSASFPGLKAEKFPWEMTCAPVALGSGASCAIKGQPAFGPIEESCLLAFDPEGMKVHFMCVTSMREVHDHRGDWTSEREIRFEAYPTTWDRQPATEDVMFEFRGFDHIRTRSIITARAGARLAFEFNGVRK